MPNSAPRASADRSGNQRRINWPMAAPNTPVTITNTAVRSGTPPTWDETATANGVATERGSRLSRRSGGRSSRLPSTQALAPAITLPTATPAASTGQ
ncbi:hypothetical protein D3C87_1970000 [compost metagenome]